MAVSYSIPTPKSPFVDQKTGLVSREWFLYLTNIFGSVSSFVGSGVTASSGPLSTNQLVIADGPSDIASLNGLNVSSVVVATSTGAIGTVPGLGTATTVLHGNVAGFPAYAVITPADAGGNTTGTAGAFVLSISPTVSTANLIGVTDGSDASSGSLGEFSTVSVASTAAIVLASGVTSTVTSLALGAGDWDVWACVGFTANSSTLFTAQTGALATSAILPTNDSGRLYQISHASTGAVDTVLPTPVIRVSSSAATTTFLLSQANFSVSTMTAYGSIEARRRR